jgi:hypothetical protein
MVRREHVNGNLGCNPHLLCPLALIAIISRQKRLIAKAAGVGPASVKIGFLKSSMH